MAQTVLFIHGAWLTPDIWAEWRRRFEKAGYETLAPGWPHLDDPAELAKVGISQLVDHYSHEIERLPEPPILVGHSFGGLIVQLLLDRGYGAAGVAIDPAPARAIFPGLTAIRTAFPVLASWLGWKRVFAMSKRAFATRFANRLPIDQVPGSYDKFIVQAPGKPFFQSALGLANGINWKNRERPPLLLMAAEEDRTVEPGMVRQSLRHYRKAGVETAFHEWKGRSHFLIAEPGWNEIADAALSWLRTVRPAQSLALQATKVRQAVGAG